TLLSDCPWFCSKLMGKRPNAALASAELIREAIFGEFWLEMSRRSMNAAPRTKRTIMTGARPRAKAAPTPRPLTITEPPSSRFWRDIERLATERARTHPAVGLRGASPTDRPLRIGSGVHPLPDWP